MPEPALKITIDTSGPETLTLPVVPTRPRLDANGQLQYDGGNIIEDPEAKPMPIVIYANRAGVVEGTANNIPVELKEGEHAVFDWYSRPTPGWRRATWVPPQRLPIDHHRQEPEADEPGERHHEAGGDDGDDDGGLDEVDHEAVRI